MNKPVILIGNGGHASVLTEILISQNRSIIGYTAFEKQINRFGLQYLGTDDEINRYKCDEIQLVLGIGSINISNKRVEIFNSFMEKGYIFSSVIHNSAIISPYASIGSGIQIMANSVIQAFTKIDDNTIINTSSNIDHDCLIGKHCHIAPGTTLSGNVTIQDYTHVGTGTTVIQNIRIGRNVLIGAGSLVIKNINDHCKAYGVPAKEV